MTNLELALVLALPVVFALGLLLGGWSYQRATDESERVDTGYEPTGTP